MNDEEVSRLLCDIANRRAKKPTEAPAATTPLARDRTPDGRSRRIALLLIWVALVILSKGEQLVGYIF